MRHLSANPLRLGGLGVVLGGAAAVMAWVTTYRVPVPHWTGMGPQLANLPTLYTSPAWTTPAAAAIAVVAVGVAAGVLSRR